MKWEFSEPRSGDMVRVKIGSIWHYGIYVSDGEVIQFGPPPNVSKDISKGDISVISTDIDYFLQSGFLEVAVLDKKESKRRFKPQKTVEIARSRVGEKGYNILYNNCEHFSHECVFGEHTCTQTDGVRSLFHSMPQLDVYYAEIPEDSDVQTVALKQRQDEIDSCSNIGVRRQKYSAWQLLESALNKSFGYDLNKLNVHKTENGQWVCDECYFSLSHSKNAVAVAVSRHPVGVDIELVQPLKREGLERKILSDSELAEFARLSENDRQDYLLRKWSAKESEFKRKGKKVFSPSGTEVTEDTQTVKVTVKGEEYYLSFTGRYMRKPKIYNNTL